MKFKTNSEPVEALEGAAVEITLETAEEPQKEAKNGSKDDDLIKEYKKIIKSRLEIIRSSLLIIEDSLQKIDDLCDATNN